MKKTAQQKAIDNRANQLNPNNPAYYKSRMGNKSKNNDKKSNTKYIKTIIIHEQSHTPAAKRGQTSACKICGAIGRLQATGKTCWNEVQIKCLSCKSKFWVKY